MNTPPPVPRPIPARSARVTLLAWLVIIVSAVLTPISIISILMTIAPHNGDWSGNPLEALSIFLGPPLTVVAGIGLLRRKNWARVYLLVLLAAVLAVNVKGIIRGPTPESTEIFSTGVPTTTLASDAPYSSVVMLICAAVIVMLCSKKTRDEFDPSSRTRGASAMSAPTTISEASKEHPAVSTPPLGRPIGWRVGHQGRDRMFYEEQVGREWKRLDIDGEMLMGRAHHVIYFASPERWQSHPEWARHRRDEIIARIKTQFTQPDYEYQGDGSQPSQTESDTQTRPQIHLSIKPARDFHSSFAVFLAAAALLCVTGWMVWLVGSGLDTGETRLPMKRASLQRAVTRATEPAMFFVSIGIYSVIGLGTLCLAAWGLKEAFQPRK